MIARQIGEAAGRDPHTVEPVLVEAVRRRLDGEMGDALVGQFGQRLVQRDRVGRGERAIDFAIRRHYADGADARGAMAERGPDLPREGGHRGLAAGAGDGGDGGRLPAMEPRRGQRQRAPRVGDRHEHRARRQRGRRLLADNGRGAGRRRLRGEGRAIGLGSRHRHEHVAALDGAAVRRDAGHADRGGAGIERSGIVQEFAEIHRGPLRIESPAV